MGASSMSIPTTDPLAFKLWARKLEYETPRKSLFWKSDMIGEGPSYPIQLKEDLRKGGKSLTIPLIGLLTGGAIVRGQTATGNEDGVDTFHFEVLTRQLRKAIKSEGEDDEQNTSYDYEEVFNMAITKWFAMRMDESILMRLAGTRGSLTGNNPVQYLAHTINSINDYNWDGNGINVPSVAAARQLYAGTAVSAATIATTDVLTVDDIEKMVHKAMTLDSTNSRRLLDPLEEGGEEIFILLIHPYALHSLRTNSSGRWYDIERAKIQGGDKQSALWSGSPGYVKLGSITVIIKVCQSLPRFTGLETGSAYTGVLTSGAGATSTNKRGVGRALLLGKQAACMAIGKVTENPYRFKIVREKMDYGDKLGLCMKINFGVAKVRFPTTNNGATYMDQGVIALDHFMTELTA